MRMILLESVPSISKQEMDQWQNANDNLRYKMLDTIITRYNNPKLEVVKEAIFNNFGEYGINPLKNEFMTLLDNIDFDLKPSHNALLNRLTELHKKEDIDLDNDYLSNPSLYNRSLQSFDYTVRLFDTVSDSSKLRRFFKNTEKINMSDLFEKDGVTIKKVGGTGPNKNSLDTLYGTVESWSGENGENDITDEYINSTSQSRKSSINNPANKVKMNKTSLKALKDKYRYMTIDQIEAKEPEVKENGTVIYAQGFTHRSTDLDDSDIAGAGFFIYNNGEWSRYENEITKAVL